MNYAIMTPDEVLNAATLMAETGLEHALVRIATDWENEQRDEIAHLRVEAEAFEAALGEALEEVASLTQERDKLQAVMFREVMKGES